MSLLTPPLVKAPVLVLAVGNPSRGDDAVGPLLAECLQAWLAQQNAEVQARIEVITDQQLVVEHVLDLLGRERVLLVDAAAQGEQVVSLSDLRAPPQHADSAERAAPQAAPISSHAATPAQLLSWHASLLKQAAPPTSLMTITGRGFELGAGLSDQARRGLREAWPHLLAWLLAEPAVTKA
jgi:hydrogenase maturation protease